jgi:hypothetical protein
MITEIIMLIVLVVLFLHSLYLQENISRGDRERACLTKKVNKLHEEKRMLESFLEVHKEEYIEKGMPCRFDGYHMVGGGSIIKEKYVKNKK